MVHSRAGGVSQEVAQVQLVVQEGVDLLEDVAVAAAGRVAAAAMVSAPVAHRASHQGGGRRRGRRAWAAAVRVRQGVVGGDGCGHGRAADAAKQIGADEGTAVLEERGSWRSRSWSSRRRRDLRELTMLSYPFTSCRSSRGFCATVEVAVEGVLGPEVALARGHGRGRGETRSPVGASIIN